MRTQKNWNVYYDGEYIGQVTETTEAYARCAAYSKYEPLDHEVFGAWDSDKLSVSVV